MIQCTRTRTRAYWFIDMPTNGECVSQQEKQFHSSIKFLLVEKSATFYVMKRCGKILLTWQSQEILFKRRSFLNLNQTNANSPIHQQINTENSQRILVVADTTELVFCRRCCCCCFFNYNWPPLLSSFWYLPSYYELRLLALVNTPVYKLWNLANCQQIIYANSINVLHWYLYLRLYTMCTQLPRILMNLVLK